MPRIPWPDVSKLDQTVQTMLARMPLGVVRMAAHASPPVFEAQGRLGYAVATPEVLDPRVRETAILRVAHLSNSAYELHHHIPIARAVGMGEAELQAIAEADYARLDPLLAAVARFVDEVVVDLSPSDATLAALRALVSDRVVVDLVMTIGLYMSVARLIAVTGVEPDEEAIEQLVTGREGS
jgi:alkylhydroperoxidase family enzyme